LAGRDAFLAIAFSVTALLAPALLFDVSLVFWQFVFFHVENVGTGVSRWACAVLEEMALLGRLVGQRVFVASFESALGVGTGRVDASAVDGVPVLFSIAKAFWVTTAGRSDKVVVIICLNVVLRMSDRLAKFLGQVVEVRTVRFFWPPERKIRIGAGRRRHLSSLYKEEI
jgi:hypothetical protein